MGSNRIHLVLILFATLFVACDIEPVAVGVWDIETEIDNVVESSVWNISREPALVVTGSRAIEVEDVEFAGSRLSWSSRDVGIGSLSGDAARANFNGTVNGNELAGTLYTQAGNFTVTGTRRASGQ